MTIKNKGIATLGMWAVGVIILALLVGWIYRDLRSSRVEVGADQTIDITPQQIQRIKAIGEWEFLSISDEELVDTIRKGLISDDHLARIYYGTMRLGVNLKEVEPGWIVARGDTVAVTMPAIRLLDRDFVDEARTKSFYESGSWAPQDREAMLKRAYRRMLQRGLTKHHLQSAKENGLAQVTQVLKSMGFKEVKVVFKE